MKKSNSDEAQRLAFRRVVETSGEDLASVIRLLRELERRGAKLSPKDLREIAVEAVKAAVSGDPTGATAAFIREAAGVRGTSLWIVEQGAQYDIPAKILELVGTGEIEDMSWHNDQCPSFGRMVERDGRQVEARVFVDHPQPRSRDMGGLRFAVTLTVDGEAHEDEVTDDVDEAISLLRSYVSRLRGV